MVSWRAATPCRAFCALAPPRQDLWAGVQVTGTLKSWNPHPEVVAGVNPGPIFGGPHCHQALRRAQTCKADQIRFRSPEPHRSPEEPQCPIRRTPIFCSDLCSVSPDIDAPVLGPNGRAHSGDPMPQPPPVVGAVCVLQVWGLPEIIRASPICLGAIELACRVQNRAQDPSGEMPTLLCPS